jgi:hypothetical protein
MRRRRGLAAVGVVLLVSACTASPQQPVPGPDVPVTLAGWQTVRLPDGLTPATVATIGDDVVVGGSVGSVGSGGGSVGSDAERRPALARGSVGDGGTDWQLVTLKPSTPYGKVASLVSVTGDERTHSLTALGAARGGAHANVRWTVWTGNTTGLVDRLQTFETFGGQEAGSLLAVVTDRVGPLVIGTWQGQHGLDGALWRADGDSWVRQPTPVALANTAGRQVAPRTATGQPDGSVSVDGSVVDLSDGVRQSAAVWRGSGTQWRLTVLPDPGNRSEAWSTACAETGSACWTVGSRDDVLAVWTDDGRAGLPRLPVGDADAGVIARHGGRVVVVASSNGSGRVLVADQDGTGDWRSYASPDGVVRAAAMVGSRLFLVSGADDTAVLSVRDLADVLAG